LGFGVPRTQKVYNSQTGQYEIWDFFPDSTSDDYYIWYQANITNLQAVPYVTSYLCQQDSYATQVDVPSPQVSEYSKDERMTLNTWYTYGTIDVSQVFYGVYVTRTAYSGYYNGNITGANIEELSNPEDLEWPGGIITVTIGAYDPLLNATPVTMTCDMPDYDAFYTYTGEPGMVDVEKTFRWFSFTDGADVNAGWFSNGDVIKAHKYDSVSGVQSISVLETKKPTGQWNRTNITNENATFQFRLVMPT
jgi:hypothetical protein